MAAKPKAVWAEIETAYRKTPETVASILRRYEISRNSFDNHRKRGDWKREHPDANAPASMRAVPQPTSDDLISEGYSMASGVADAVTTAASGLMGISDENSRIAELEARLAAAETELAAYKPVTVKWPWDRKAAAELLAATMRDQIEDDLIALNRERAARHLSPMTVEQMEAMEPGWWEKQKSRLIDEAVHALDAYANTEGPARHKIVMLTPNGDRQQIPLEEGIGNYKPGPDDPYIRKLEGKGFKKVVPEVCPRWDCWKPKLPEFGGFCGALHYELEQKFAGVRRRGITTSGEFTR